MRIFGDIHANMEWKLLNNKEIAKKLKVVEFKLKEVDKRKDLVTCEKTIEVLVLPNKNLPK